MKTNSRFSKLTRDPLQKLLMVSRQMSWISFTRSLIKISTLKISLPWRILGSPWIMKGGFWNWFKLCACYDLSECEFINSDSKPLKVNESGKFTWIFCSVDKELAQALVKILPQYFTPRILQPKIGHRFPKPRFNLTPFSGKRGKRKRSDALETTPQTCKKRIRRSAVE